MPRDRVEWDAARFRHLFRRRHPTLWSAFDSLEEEGIASAEVDHLKEFLVAQAKGKNGRGREGSN